MLIVPDKLLTEDQIAQDVINNFDPDDLFYFKQTPDALINCHLDRFIRNQYNLWWTHPLTEQWRNCPDNRNIIDGVDHSVDHPDRVSYNIVNKIIQIIKG